MPPLATLMRSVTGTARRQAARDHSDSELLGRYLQENDADAFALLLDRHGPMVLGVCRRILRNAADAEDAFQATFLVLVRKAADIHPRHGIANWLYGVARRTARKALALKAARLRKERTLPQPTTIRADDDGGEDLQYLDEALHALPAKYRAPLLLCALEGKTMQEAARDLGWPLGTVACRIARGRTLLARRLARHGLLPAALAGPLHLTAGQVPPALHAITLRFTTGAAPAAAGIPPHVVQLSQSVLSAMNLSRWLGYALLLGLFALSVLGLTAAALWPQTVRHPAPAPHQTPLPTSAQEQRRKNTSAWQGEYLPKQAEFHRDHGGRWLAIVDGRILPRAVDGTVSPARSLADAAAAAQRVAPEAKHRFLFQIGTEGDVSHQLGASGESNRIGRPFAPHAVKNYIIAYGDGQVWFEVNNQKYRVGVSGPHQGAPYVAPQVSAPLADQGRELKMLMATGIDAIAVITPELAEELDLEKWEIPGQATLSGVKHPCRRASLRFRWKEPAIDAVVPVVIWEGFVPPKAEEPLQIPLLPP